MTYTNILIVKLSAIGDVIHALPVSHALKERYPKARITWVVEKPAYDLLTNNPDIDDIIIFDKPKFKSLSGLLQNTPAFAKQLRQRRFDLTLDLQGLFKSAIISWLSRSEQRLGYCNMRELSHLVSVPVCGENQNGHVVDRYLDVVRAVGCDVKHVLFPIYITEEEAAAATSIASKAGLNINKPYVILAPGTNWPTKCWPTSHYAGLADKLFDSGLIPVIIGGQGDNRLANDIISTTRIPPVDLTGRTNLKQLAYIVKHSRAFVGGDTGPMHLAVAMETPVVTMFGPSNPYRNGPYHGNNIVLVAKKGCIQCQRRKCHEACLETISLSEVFESLQLMLTTRRRP